MAIGQLFYTSCKKGLSSGMGFQTYSMTKSITEEDRKDIEGYCVYIPPDYLPTQPSAEEIDKLFPIAFSSFRLQSGKYCVCRAQYTGKDYSGRYGNYFCHVLISDKPWDFYPIELYGSTIFRGGLSKEEENSSEIDYLPELKEIPLGNLVNFDNISGFLKGNQSDKRRKSFIQIMENIIGYNKDRKRIIFTDDKDSIPLWIGAIQMSLPKKLALQFSFTTYCYNPEDVNYILCAIDKEENKLNPRNVQKYHKYHICDFINGPKEEIACSSSFVKRAEIGYTVSKEVFVPFISFLDEFEYNLLDEEIDSCVSLYNMVKKGVEKSDFDGVKKSLNFAIKYKSIDAYNELFHQLDPKLEKLSMQVDVELAELITKFLFKAGREVNNNEHIRKAYEFFFYSIYHLLVDAEDISLEDILDLYKKIKGIEDISIIEFVKVSLKPTRIKEIQTYLEGGKTRHARFYFKSIVQDIIDFNEKGDSRNKKTLFGVESKEDKDITKLLSQCLKMLMTSTEELLDVFNYFKNKPEYFSKIILRAYYINNYSYKNSRIEELIADFIITGGNQNRDWKNKMYSLVSKLTSSNDLFFSVYSLELRKSIDQNDFFVNYCNEVFNSYKNYREKKFSEALNLYLGTCDNDNTTLEEYKRIINYITQSSIVKIIDKNVLKKLFTYFEEKLDIENAEEEEGTIEKVYELKSEYKVKTNCSITELLYIGVKIQSIEVVNKAALMQELEVDFSNMGDEKYENYLKWFLSNICIHLKDSRDHSKVKKALFCEEYSIIFYNIYMDSMEDIVLTKKYKEILKSCNKEGYEIFLDFLLLIFKNLEELDGEIEKLIDDRSISILAKISEKKLEDYSNYFLKESSNLTDEREILIKWREVLRKAKKRSEKKGILGLLKKVTQKQ